MGSQTVLPATETEPGFDVVQLIEHELTGPLIVISGAAALLADQETSIGEPQRRELVDAITRNARTAARLVARLAQLRKLQWDEIALQPEPVDVAVLVRDVVRDLEYSGHDVAVVVVDAPEPVFAHVDLAATQEILTNLLVNAVHHGEGDRPVRATVRSGGDGPVVRVRDHGPGVTGEDRERIFEPYVRGAPLQPGLGIGLSLGRGLAEAQGGALRLLPTPADGGSEFELVLPGVP